jgi:hypothetical protein
MDSKKESFFPMPLPLLIGLSAVGYFLAKGVDRIAPRIEARELAIPYVEWRSKARAGDLEAKVKVNIANKRLVEIHDRSVLGDSGATSFLEALKKYNITESDYLSAGSK